MPERFGSLDLDQEPEIDIPPALAYPEYAGILRQLLERVMFVVLAWNSGRILDAYGPFKTEPEAKEWILRVLGDARLGQIVELQGV